MDKFEDDKDGIWNPYTEQVHTMLHIIFTFQT